jgi:NAD(P)H-binding
MVDTTVVIDLANSLSDEDKAVMEFFETSGRNLLAAEVAAGVKRDVALSIIGADRMPDNGYYRAKVAQEKLIEASGIPYTIVRPTQFMEFLGFGCASLAHGRHGDPAIFVCFRFFPGRSARWPDLSGARRENAGAKRSSSTARTRRGKKGTPDHLHHSACRCADDRASDEGRCHRVPYKAVP